MAALPYIQLYVADYLADTAHLSTEEHGAYLLLIFNYWQRGKPLPNNDIKLARIARLPNERWTDVKQTLEEFFNITEIEWQHSRIDNDLKAVITKHTRASKAGKASAAARKASRKVVKKQGIATDVEQPLNHKETDTDIDTEEKEDKEKGAPGFSKNKKGKSMKERYAEL